MGVSAEDKKFLEAFMSDELTEKGMRILDKKLENPEFKTYYNQKLAEKYNKPTTKLVLDYLPMIIMICLVIFGFYLFLKSN